MRDAVLRVASSCLGAAPPRAHIAALLSQGGAAVTDGQRVVESTGGGGGDDDAAEEESEKEKREIRESAPLDAGRTAARRGKKSKSGGKSSLGDDAKSSLGDDAIARWVMLRAR
jgi:hypothetical protein